MRIDKYLNRLQDEGQASVMTFHMDSPHMGKKRKKKVKEQKFSTPAHRDRVMIDFDGVIHSYEKGWNNGEIYGNVIDKAKESIEKLRQKYEIVIFTTRAAQKTQPLDGPTSEELVKDLKEWLDKNGIYYDKITGDKLGAFAYIDDNAIEFTTWDDVMIKLQKKEEKE